LAELRPLSYPPDQRDKAQQRTAFPFSAQTSEHQTAADPTKNRMLQLEQMLQEAQGRAEIIEKEAYEKAYMAGEKAGMALGKKRGEQILEALQQSLQSAEQQINAIKDAFPEAIMQVASHIAEQIIGDKLTQESAGLLEIARQAATQLPDTEHLRIAVSPDEFALFKRMLDEDNDNALKLCSDASVTDGTCRIISSSQDILIDPIAAVSRYIHQLKPQLLKSRQISMADHND